MKKLLALTLAPLALTACGVGPAPTPKTATVTETATTTAEPTTEPSSSTTTTAEPATAEPTSTSSTTAEPTTTYDDTAGDGDMTIGFGETFEWEDGVKVMLSEPTAFTPTEYAAGGEGYPHHVKITVTIVNDSDGPLDSSFTTPTVQSGQREGDEVFDEGLDGSPLGAILPGRTVTYDAGYGIDDPSDIVAEFAPTWDHDYAYWD